MSKSRNERRKAAQARLTAKTVRLVSAHVAAGLDKGREIVKDNMTNKPERNYYPQSSMSLMAGQSHRGLICRASGNMSKNGAMALRAKGSW